MFFFLVKRHSCRSSWVGVHKMLIHRHGIQPTFHYNSNSNLRLFTELWKIYLVASLAFLMCKALSWCWRQHSIVWKESIPSWTFQYVNYPRSSEILEVRLLSHCFWILTHEKSSVLKPRNTKSLLSLGCS